MYMNGGINNNTGVHIYYMLHVHVACGKDGKLPVSDQFLLSGRQQSKSLRSISSLN